MTLSREYFEYLLHLDKHKQTSSADWFNWSFAFCKFNLYFSFLFLKYLVEYSWSCKNAFETLKRIKFQYTQNVYIHKLLFSMEWCDGTRKKQWWLMMMRVNMFFLASIEIETRKHFSVCILLVFLIVFLIASLYPHCTLISFQIVLDKCSFFILNWTERIRILLPIGVFILFMMIGTRNGKSLWKITDFLPTFGFKKQN